MFLTPLIALVLAAVPTLGQLDSTTAATTLPGTWSSGSMAVRTGAGFAHPANESFTYPKTTGISYSFTSDGFYEIARYRFVSNGTVPQCVTGVINWAHGTYVLQSNGSITMVPFGDGYQQIQDPCAAQSNFIENYNDTELYELWQIFLDPVTGYKLHLFQFDGSPLAPQFQVSATPNMLPTQSLRNVSGSAPATTAAVTTRDLLATSGGQRRWSVSGTIGVVTVVFGAGLATLLL